MGNQIKRSQFHRAFKGMTIHYEHSLSTNGVMLIVVVLLT